MDSIVWAIIPQDYVNFPQHPEGYWIPQTCERTLAVDIFDEARENAAIPFGEESSLNWQVMDLNRTHLKWTLLNATNRKSKATSGRLSRFGYEKEQDWWNKEVEAWENARHLFEVEALRNGDHVAPRHPYY